MVFTFSSSSSKKAKIDPSSNNLMKMYLTPCEECKGL